ncbi:hypothetical protein NA57DRAFT_60863 [Rhizodiscina lignyota]|uniref:Uncharacterized protein n=1 Tax=Rhizodiscina lignyota TaxID=1504668 RepID=A0A9P4I7N8_9PEZI|nr:hypothetical protein NA57DRAFT_60863 [Rhizodiscina lignyota]
MTTGESWRAGSILAGLANGSAAGARWRLGPFAQEGRREQRLAGSGQPSAAIDSGDSSSQCIELATTNCPKRQKTGGRRGIAGKSRCATLWDLPAWKTHGSSLEDISERSERQDARSLVLIGDGRSATLGLATGEPFEVVSVSETISSKDESHDGCGGGQGAAEGQYAIAWKVEEAGVQWCCSGKQQSVGRMRLAATALGAMAVECRGKSAELERACESFALAWSFGLVPVDTRVCRRAVWAVGERSTQAATTLEASLASISVDPPWAALYLMSNSNTCSTAEYAERLLTRRQRLPYALIRACVHVVSVCSRAFGTTADQEHACTASRSGWCPRYHPRRGHHSRESSAQRKPSTKPDSGGRG